MIILQRINVTNSNGLNIQAFMGQLSASKFRYFYETWDNQAKVSTTTQYSEYYLNSAEAFNHLINFAKTHSYNGGKIKSVSSMENIQLLKPNDMQRIVDRLCPGIAIEHV